MKRDIAYVFEAVNDFYSILEVLHGDILELTKLSGDTPSDFLLRTHVRAFFALVEGTSYGLRQITFAYYPFNPCLTMAELHLLTESSYELTDGGEAKERKRYLDTLQGIKFTFKMIGKVFTAQSGVEFIGLGWTSFQQAMRIRNAITHPKSTTALKLYDPKAVFDNKFQQILSAADWYHEKLNWAMSVINSALQSPTE